MERAGRLGAALACGAIFAAGIVAVRLTAAPAPRPASASDTAFSAERAYRHVERLATDPRPVGSEAHRRARTYLMTELRRLGLSPRIGSGTAFRASEEVVVAADLDNVVVRLPGRSDAPAVLLVAHYDSRPQTPGAGDDAAGVAAIVETLRALTAGSRLDRDVLALFTDGEELGLLGARHFAATDPAMDDVGVVLNLEARGNRGVVTMFQSSRSSLPMIRQLATVPYPVANSLSAEVYRRMPNDTDLTVFLERGVAAMNFAFIGGWHAYHHMLDRPERLSRASLQHLGELALEVTRRLAETTTSVSGREAVYFNPLPGRLVSMSRGVANWLVGVLAVAVVALVVWSKAVRRWHIALAAGSFLVALVLPGLVVLALWRLAVRIVPALTDGPHGVPYAQGLYEASLWVLVAAVVLGVVRWTAGRCSSVELGLGWLLGLTVLVIVVGIALPGAVFVPLWPALWLTVAWGWIAWRRRRRRRATTVLGSGDLAVLAAAAVPGVVLLAPLTHSLFTALSIPGAAAIGCFVALTLAVAAVPLAVSVRHWREIGIVAVVGVTLLAVAVGESLDFGPERPRVDSLAYVLDGGTGSARWLSRDASTDGWTERLLGEDPSRSSVPRVLGGTEALIAPAPFASLAPPGVRLIGEERHGGERRLELEAVSRRGAPVLRLALPAGARVRAIGNEAVDADGARRLIHYGAGSDGVRISVAAADAGPLTVDVVDQSWGFEPLGAAAPRPRPPRIIPSSGWATDSVMVSSSSWIP